MRRTFLFALLWAVAAAQAADGPRSLTLATDQQRLLGIGTAPVETARMLSTPGLVGTVQLPLAGTAAVASPYAGRALTVAVDEGDAVSAGQALATIASREYAEARAALTVKQAQLDLARRVEARDAELLAAGVIPAARAEASRAARATAAADLGALAATVGDVTPAPNAPAAFRLLAPVGGRVVERRIAVGEALDALAVAFVVAGDEGWRLEAQVPLALAASIGEGATLTVGDLVVPISGRALGVDPSTQRVRVRAALPAGSGFAPGQQLKVTLDLPAPADARAVPRAAVSRMAERAFVFVARGDSFLWTPVEVLGESGAQSVIRGSLEAGERVVVSGIAALKAQLAD